MRNVIIIATGGCASEVTFYIEQHNELKPENERINILGYIDYETYISRQQHSTPVCIIGMFIQYTICIITSRIRRSRQC